MTYTDLWEIIQSAQKGSGYTKSKDTSRAQTILDSLRQKGWSKSYLKTTFHNLDDQLLTGWPDELFQDMYFKERAEVFQTVEESLKRMGINPAKIKETLTVIAPLENTCYTQKQLLDVAIEYILGHYAPITGSDVTHFFQPTIHNKWIPYEQKAIMNMTYSCRYTALKRFENQVSTLFPATGGKVFFHTTNWQSSHYIMNSIQRDKGRPCLDFNYKRAFYVSETEKDAIDWGVRNSKKWKDEIAILLFYIPHNFQTQFAYKDLTEDRKEWEWVVTSFRNCKEISAVRRYDDTHDFIYGPMLANPAYYDSEGPKQFSPTIMQLAAKTSVATKFLYSCMKGAFVFRKLHKN